MQKIKLKLKIAGIVIAVLVFFIMFLMLKDKSVLRAALEYQKARIKSEIELAELQEQDSQTKAELWDLKEKEINIRNIIEGLDKKEDSYSENLPIEDLIQFFKVRGF